MARNVEIKARIASVEALVPLVAAIATEGPAVIVQDDSFFACDRGRLKLRSFSDEDCEGEGEGELIFYRRADASGPKESFYLRSPTASPGTLREALTLAFGEVGRVRKHRTVFLVGRTRVHLDRVHGLGDFLELEVVLGDEEAVEVGVAEAHELMARLALGVDQFVDVAYVDLIAAEGTRPPVASDA